MNRFALLFVLCSASIANAGSMVSVPSPGGPVMAYVATPVGAPKGAPDLYHGKVATDPELAHELMRGLPDARAIHDIRAAEAYAHGAKKTAVIGFCMGGRLAQLAALGKGPFDATVMCYGSPDAAQA